ncbi:MAG TPA: CAP domain-containing protein [Planctomycetota bacterium]|nr:CAP domain-containing protein [Planctomycetota bacterium]
MSPRIFLPSVLLALTLLLTFSPVLHAAALTQEMMQRGQEAVARLNLYRKSLGLADVVYDATLSEGCALHAAYLNLNKSQIEAGLDAHNEYPDRPGFTQEGKEAGENSDISYGFIGADAVTVWYNIYFHRSPMVSKSVTKIGYGDNPGDKTGYSIAVLRFSFYGEITELVTPGDKSAGNATHPETGETPPPIPNFGPTNGIPIIAYFNNFDANRVTWVASTITANGQSLAHQVVAPNKNFNTGFEGNEIALITDNPLPRSANIMVSIDYKDGSGADKKKEWSFTTSSTGKFDPAAAAGAGGGGGTIDNVTDEDSDGFPDLVEVTAQTNKSDATSTPFNNQPAGAAQALSLSKLSLKLNFVTHSDSLSLSGAFAVPDSLVLNGQKLIVDAGGIVRVYQLDVKGKAAPNALEKVSVSKPKNGSAKYSIKINKTNLAAAYTDEGFDGARDRKNELLNVTVTMYFNNTKLTIPKPVYYSSKLLKSGSAKNVP